MADLEGQIEVELAGRIDSAKGGGLRATFATVPDAPVTKFVLNMQGGKKGLLINSTNLCGEPRRPRSQMDGQNGRASNTKKKLQTACGERLKAPKARLDEGGARHGDLEERAERDAE